MNKAQRYDPNGSIRPSYTVIVIFVNTIFKCFISESLRNVVIILFKCKLCELSNGIPAFLQKAGMGPLRFELRYRRYSHWMMCRPMSRTPKDGPGYPTVPLLVWCYYINQFYMSQEYSPATIS